VVDQLDPQSQRSRFAAHLATVSPIAPWSFSALCCELMTGRTLTIVDLEGAIFASTSIDHRAHDLDALRA
jgi:hypothetical protein